MVSREPSSRCARSTLAERPVKPSSNQSSAQKTTQIVRFNDLKVSDISNFVVLNKNGTVSVHAKDGRELESYNIVIGSVISAADGASVKKGETFIQWDPYNVLIITEKAGKVEFRDMIQGVTIRQGGR